MVKNTQISMHYAMLIIRSDVLEYKCVKRDHHIGIRHLCKITYCRILFTTEKKLTEIWGSSSLLPRLAGRAISHLNRPPFRTTSCPTKAMGSGYNRSHSILLR